MSLKMYADKGCTQPLQTIGWDEQLKITLVDGEVIEGVQAGRTATVTVYVKNEGLYLFGVTKISHPDSRLELSIEKGKIRPNASVKLTVKFRIPKNPTSKDVIEAGEITIEGYEAIGVS